jgi:hypothetical protein
MGSAPGSGELARAWRDTFAVVARHGFIPNMIWVTNGAELVTGHRTYGPRSVITQVDDGHPASVSSNPCIALTLRKATVTHGSMDVFHLAVV